MYGTLVQNVAAAAFGTENALTAAADPDITQQGGQYIFTGDYQLLADAMVGVSVTLGRYSVAEWNGRGRLTISSANRALTPPASPTYTLYYGNKLPLPKNQQIQSLVTNNLGAATEIENLIWQIGTPDWSLNQPPGLYDIVLHATAAITPTLNAWQENVALTFDQTPLGGAYVVLGARVVGANSVAFRLNFPRTRLYGGRRLRPGGLVQTAFGDAVSAQLGDPFGGWGVMGAFHTFEPPTLGVFGAAAAATTYNIFLKCRFLGQQVTLLDSFVAGNY